MGGRGKASVAGGKGKTKKEKVIYISSGEVMSYGEAKERERIEKFEEEQRRIAEEARARDRERMRELRKQERAAKKGQGKKGTG